MLCADRLQVREWKPVYHEEAAWMLCPCQRRTVNLPSSRPFLDPSAVIPHLNLCHKKAYIPALFHRFSLCLSHVCRDWGQGEDVEWGNHIPMRTDVAPEENPFISVQFLKLKGTPAYWAQSFYDWLVASGNGEYVQPRRLDARFWCNDTTACA